MSVPQFGEPEPGRDYPDRPAAFAVVSGEDGKIAVVRVSFSDGGSRLDLPGGGIDEGESAAQAVARECGEEAGLRITLGDAFVRADHYFVNEKGVSRNTRGTFFTATVAAAAPELKTEDDHALAWLAPEEALRRLDRDSHAWAVAVWLRRPT